MDKIKENYKKRLIDKKIIEHFKVFDWILVEGPKWCGKTWTSTNAANDEILLSNEDTRKKIELRPELIFDSNSYKSPLLIDEWQNVPKIWDLIRNYVDRNKDMKFILTGSSSFNRTKARTQIFHSGTGRVSKLKMGCLSLFESGDSDGKVSLIDMYNKNDFGYKIKQKSLEEIVSLIVKGGWPQNFKNNNDKDKSINYSLLPKKYIDSLLKNDIHEFGKKNKKIASMILRSIARNESTLVSNKTLIRDVFEYENDKELTLAQNTLNNYLELFRDLYIFVEDDAFDINFRSSKKVGKTPKRHLVDPSLSCALLNLNEKKLINDLETLGFMFEALVERDLRIYAEYLDGKLYHFRDNSTNLKIDAIIEFEDGEYGIFEIKLGKNQIDEAIKNIEKFRDNVVKKPKFSCIIVGLIDFAIYNKEKDIYIIPITSLKPN